MRPQFWGIQTHNELIQAHLNETLDAIAPYWTFLEEEGGTEELGNCPATEVFIPFYFATRKSTMRNRLEFFSLIMSLKWKVWLCSGILLLLISLLIFITEKHSDKFERLIDYILSAFILWGSRPSTPAKKFVNVLTLFWTMGAILLAGVYIWAIFSSMQKSILKPPFNDFHSLLNCLESLRCKMVLHPNAPISKVFLQDPSSKYFAIQENFRKNPPLIVRNFSEQIKIIRETSDVFLVSEMFTGNELIRYNVNACDLYLMEQQEEFRFLFRKGYKYARHFSELVRRGRQWGRDVHLIRKYFYTPSCNSVSNTKAKPILIEHVLVAVLLLFGGVAAASVCLVFERIISKYKHD